MCNYRRLAWLLALLFLVSSSLFAMKEEQGAPDKKFDLLKWHDVGNIWLRVSNYGFFGSGDDITPQWPSLEYPGGSGIDYLYQGSLWFGAKKYRRNAAGRRLYWLHFPPQTLNDYVDEDYPGGVEGLTPVIDTLVTVGFDGDNDLYEFLPAYNPIEQTVNPVSYQMYNLRDTVLYSSIRRQRAGYDDDGDGLIDEDPPGHAFRFRPADELPSGMDPFGGMYLADVDPTIEAPLVTYFNEERGIWFPLGFLDLGSLDDEREWCFAEPWDDDGSLVDEDGYPVSEQDYIGYYYDYSPFGTTGQRDWGSRKGSNDHVPLNVFIRQMSYQWSYDYIKNLVYVEFDITNMNTDEYLYDCAMGVYMDSDVGPQSWGSDERSLDDISSYVAGEGFEFAYTYDADTDQGLTTGYVGSRVCTPDPDSLEFACWTWERGDGPDDEDPLGILVHSGSPTANQKYWLLTDRNPDSGKYTSLRQFPDTQLNDPCDTRYLFAFYGDMTGLAETPTSNAWNLAPGATMKIVIAVFPGESVEELKQTAEWAKEIYGTAQTLSTVVLPDTFPHYQPPEPPTVPAAVYIPENDGRTIRFIWDNRSEFFYDYQTVSNGAIGWQDQVPALPSYDPNILPGDDGYNPNALVDPETGDILRHDFQGYRIWKRIGSGSQEDWVPLESWDKVDTDTDRRLYTIVKDLPEANYVDYGGDIGVDTGLPNRRVAEESDTAFYRLNNVYELQHYAVGDTIYGFPIYDPDVADQATISHYLSVLTDPNQNPKYNSRLSQFENEALIFRHPDISEDVYLALYDDGLITVANHLGENQDVMEATMMRLARRYYDVKVDDITQRGVENYLAVTAFDRGMPSKNLMPLESGRDSDANMVVLFAGPSARSNMDDIYVVPNPYTGLSAFDGRRENDDKGDKSRRIWFVNLPEQCTIRIYTLAGDLVDKIEHNGAYMEDVITVSKASKRGIAASGIHAWDLLSKHNQIVVSGVYLFSVEDKDSGDIKVGKFVIIR